MPQVFSNGARAKLDTSIGFDSVTLTISSGGSLFPVANYSGVGTLSQASPENWFKLVIQDDVGMEIVYCYEHTIGSNIFGNLRRGQEGTTARAFTNEAIVGLRPLAKDMADLVQSNKTISESLEGKADKTGNITGNAATATKLESPRAISISGGVTAAAKNFDGTMPLDLEVTALDVSKANQGTLAVERGGTGTTTATGSGSVVLSQSPTLTGTPLAPTAPVGTNTDQVATAALVKATADGKVDVVAGSRLITSAEAAKIASNESALATKVSKTSDTGAAQLPSGTEAQRPDPATTSGLLLRGNEATGKVEYYDRIAGAWKVVGSGGGNLFDFHWHNGTRGTIIGGRIACDGQQLTQLMYPEAYAAVVAGMQHAVTDAAWLADPAKRNCWSTGDSGWVRVPDLNGAFLGDGTYPATGKPFYLRGGANGLGGTSVGDAIRNITGDISGVDQTGLLGIFSTGVSGAFTGGATSTKQIATGGTVDPGWPSGRTNKVTFDASKTVPTADENRVKTAYGAWTVTVATEAANGGTVDMLEVATKVNALEVSVAQKLDADKNVNRGTAVIATGTVLSFTIPAAAKRITLLIFGVTFSGAGDFMVQCGTSGGFETTGYVSTANNVANPNAVGGASNTSGFINRSASSANTSSGTFVIEKLSDTELIYTSMLRNNPTNVAIAAGSKTLASALTQIRLLSSNGSDTYTSGKVVAMWE